MRALSVRPIIAWYKRLKTGTIVGFVSAVAAVTSATIAYQIGTAQNRIQSEAARTAQTGWLTPGKTIYTKTTLGAPSLAGYVPDVSGNIALVEVPRTFDLMFYVYNRSQLPLTLLAVGFYESPSNEPLLWVDFLKKLRGHVTFIALDDVVGHTLDPGDSLLITEPASFWHADSLGRTSGHMMVVCQSPFGRVAVTYVWADYFSATEAKPGPRLCNPPAPEDVRLSAIAHATYRNHAYKVLQDRDEILLFSVRPDCQQIDSLRTLDEIGSRIRGRERLPAP